VTSGRGIAIAAPGSGTGKTSLACGILRALRRRGVAVRAAKCGPDYLDPMWLERAAGSPCPNLDPWMAGPDGVRELAAGEGLLVVETAMGLYDGIRPESDEGSGFEVSRILELPVLLVVDASGAARTVAAVVRGLRDFGPAAIAGVVANRVGSARHAEMVGQALASAGLPSLVGFVPQGALPVLPERHLGLLPPGGSDEVLERLADAVEATVDLDAVRRLAGPASAARKTEIVERNGEGLRLGLSWDDAFRFAYGPVVDRLRARGVEMVRFSPLADASLPADLDGLWLCGGYPEVHAVRLAGNGSMRGSVAAFCASGRPALAECGGLLYLATEIVDHSGGRHPMCGVVPGIGRMGNRLRSLGYRTATAREDLFVAARGGSLRGHEFHYGSLEGDPDGNWRRAYDLEGSRGPLGTEGWWNGSVLATWFHGWLAGADVLDRWIDGMRAARGRKP
jgi:cobyrinic acid a,c-diamide synthase